MDGWEFLEKIREEYGMKDLPVLLFTASPSEEERRKTLHDPRPGVLSKPVSIPDLKVGPGKFPGK